MPKKVSAEVLNKLRSQQKEMGGGLIITNKNFTKLRCRILPIAEDAPGKEYIGLYCESLKKGTTSPRTFGNKCPVMDYIDKVKRTGEKDEKEHVKNYVNIQREYWMGVVSQEDRDTRESNAVAIRILCAKRSVYEEIIKFMMDEDDGEDITDPKEGRDIRVKKEGSGMDTQWTVKFLDREPVSNDEDYVSAFVEAAKGFNVEDHFFKVDYDTLGEIYTNLTGEPIPDEYLEGVDTKSSGKKSGGKVSKVVTKDDDEDDKPAAAPAKSSKPATAGPAKKKTVETEPEPEADEAAEFPREGARCSFKDADGNDIEAEVLKQNEDGSWDVKDTTGEVWGVNADDLTEIAAEEAEPEAEPEAEEEAPAPAPAKKGPVAKGGGTPAAPAKPATPAGPRKPTPTKASGSIKDRLASAKK